MPRDNSRNDIDSVRVAKIVGVSRSTVSKVVNGYPNVSATTREKVLKVIKDHHYYPNLSARILAGKRTNTIGLFFITHGHFSDDILVNFMIASVIENAARHSYHVLTYIIRDPEDQRTLNTVREVFYQRRIDGGVFIGGKNHEPIIEGLITEGFNVGVFDQNLPGKQESNRVVVNLDDETVAKDVILYLAGLGHREILVFNGDQRRNAGVAKLRGFRRGLRESGISLDDSRMLFGDFSTGSGYETMKRYLHSAASLPTAVAAVNDNVAFGIIRALNEADIQIPDQVSVIGIDGHPLGEYSHPPLTTFSFDFEVMMDSLISGVVRLVESPDRARPESTVLTAKLVERSSCGPSK